MKTLRFWTLFALLAPLLLLQAAWVQSTARRLPAGTGAREGRVDGSDGPETPLGLLCLGESPMAGIGVADFADSVGVCLARALSRRAGRAVCWQVLAANGRTALKVWREDLERLPERSVQLAVIALGVNDTTALTPLTHFSGQVAAIARRLRERYGCRVYVAGVPPVGLFSALPQPLRYVLGLRAGLLQQALRDHAEAGRGYTLLDVEFPMRPELLAADGYHPSAAGHAWWGQALAAAIVSAPPHTGADPAPARQSTAAPDGAEL